MCVGWGKERLSKQVANKKTRTVHEALVFADDVAAVVLIVAQVALVNLDAAVRSVVVLRHHVKAEVTHVPGLPPAHLQMHIH